MSLWFFAIDRRNFITIQTLWIEFDETTACSEIRWRINYAESVWLWTASKKSMKVNRFSLAARNIRGPVDSIFGDLYGQVSKAARHLSCPLSRCIFVFFILGLIVLRSLAAARCFERFSFELDSFWQYFACTVSIRGIWALDCLLLSNFSIFRTLDLSIRTSYLRCNFLQVFTSVSKFPL